MEEITHKIAIPKLLIFRFIRLQTAIGCKRGVSAIYTANVSCTSTT